MRNWFENFMRGRYGIDPFGKTCFALIIILIVTSFFVPNPILSTISMLVLIYAYFRMLSRNTAKRSAENEAFMRLTRAPRVWFNTQKRDMAIRKTHHLFKCPNCRQKIKVPKGKGRIMIRCPKCSTEFQKVS